MFYLSAGESSTDAIDSSANQMSEEGSHDPLTCPIVPGQETSILIEKGRTGLGLSIVGGADTLLVSCSILSLILCGNEKN